ncbi:hypothetical protein [Demequina sp.]|uniref:hypothetical protein n=1 Tax=Demequina sp. TaxID=2050685 RepID=UPI003D150A4F
MSRETWGKFLKQMGIVVLTFFATQGVLFYLGSDPMPLVDAGLVVGILALTMWLILFFSPTYYDRKSTKGDVPVN